MKVEHVGTYVDALGVWQIVRITDASGAVWLEHRLCWRPALAAA